MVKKLDFKLIKTQPSVFDNTIDLLILALRVLTIHQVMITVAKARNNYQHQ